MRLYNAMKLSALAAGTILLFACSAHAYDHAKYALVLQDIMKFPDQPTKEAYYAIEDKIELLRFSYYRPDDQHIILVTSAFLVGAHDRYGWPISGDSQIGKAALEIISGKGKPAAYLNDDRMVNGTKIELWWMSYFGSQDEAYLFKLLKYAGDPAPQNRVRALRVQLASQSFKANCQQIKSVQEFARRVLNDPAYKDRKAFLLSCLK